MRLVRAVVLAAAALITLVGSPGVDSTPLTVPLVPASDDAATSWSVVPGDGAGVPDGRPWVELTLAPGETATEQMVITNHGTEATQFQLTAADGYFTDTGRFNMLPSDRPSTDAGTWVAIQPSVELQGGETRSVPFTVTVPTNATPGDHPAGVAANITTGAGGQVGIESRVGFRVMTRVTGDLTPEVRTSAQASYAQSWNPFIPGTLTVTYTIQNTGNTRLTAAPVVLISGPFGVSPETVTGDAISELAPDESRTSTIAVRRWPLVIGTVDVRAEPAVVAVDGTAAPIAPSTATTTVLALPIGQAVVATGFVVLVLVWTRDRRTRQRRVDQLVSAAREEGRRDGAPLDSGGASSTT